MAESPPIAVPDLQLAWIEHGQARTSVLDCQRWIGLTYRCLLASDEVRSLIDRLGWVEVRWSVYGCARHLDEFVSAGDRLELLPPLKVDPKTARARRVEHRRRQASRSMWLPDRRL